MIAGNGFIRSEHVRYIREFNNIEPRRPFTKIYTFKKNNMSMTRMDFKDLFDSLSDYLTNLNVNFGILMTPDGTFVFTEEKIKFDPLVVKLSTGINFGKQVDRVTNDLQIVNSGLDRV